MFRELVNIAIAVVDVDQAVDRFSRAFGWEMQGQVKVQPRLMLRTAHLKAGASEIEVISPLPGEVVVRNFLAKHGEGVYRIAFRVDYLDDMLTRLEGEKMGFADISTSVGDEGRRIIVVHPKATHGIMVEMIEQMLEE